MPTSNSPRVGHAARGTGNRTEASPTRAGRPLPSPITPDGRTHAWMGDRGIMIRAHPRLHGDRSTPGPGGTTAAAATTPYRSWTHLAGGAATRLSSRPRISSEAGRDAHHFRLRGNTITLDRNWITCTSVNHLRGDERGEVVCCRANPPSGSATQRSHIRRAVMAMGATRCMSPLDSRGWAASDSCRYPIHWHLAGDAKGQYIRNSAIHDTCNRC